MPDVASSFGWSNRASVASLLSRLTNRSISVTLTSLVIGLYLMFHSQVQTRSLSSSWELSMVEFRAESVVCGCWSQSRSHGSARDLHGAWEQGCEWKGRRPTPVGWNGRWRRCLRGCYRAYNMHTLFWLHLISWLRLMSQGYLLGLLSHSLKSKFLTRWLAKVSNLQKSFI